MSKQKLKQTIQFTKSLGQYLPEGIHSNFGLADKRIVRYFIKGKNSRLWDIDGNEYLDLFCRYGAMFLGHSNSEYNETLKEVLKSSLNLPASTIEYETCELLSHIFPCCEQMSFGLSGTDVVMQAIRLARAYTNKPKFIRFAGNFHGTGESFLGGIAKDSTFVPSDPGEGVFSTQGRAPGELETQSILLPWNDIEILEKTIESYKDIIAAVLLEPIAVNAGSIFPADGYLEKIRLLCSKHNIILIFDEIITGIRVHIGGAQTMLGVTPDIALLGKCIGGGSVPITVLVGKKQIFEAYKNNNIAYGERSDGYSLGLAAIHATIRILQQHEEEHYNNMRRIAREIHSIILRHANRYGIDMVVQGPESCASFHCTTQELSRPEELTREIALKNSILRECMISNGIMICPTSRMYTNISLNDSDVYFFEQHCRQAIEDAAVLFERLI